MKVARNALFCWQRRNATFGLQRSPSFFGGKWRGSSLQRVLSMHVSRPWDARSAYIQWQMTVQQSPVTCADLPYVLPCPTMRHGFRLLYRFYALAIDHVALRDRVRQLELAAVGATRGSGSAATGGRAPVAGTGGKGAAAVEPSAPPAPAELLPGGKEDKKGK